MRLRSRAFQLCVPIALLFLGGFDSARAGAWSLAGIPSVGPLGGGPASPIVQVQFAGDGATFESETAVTIPAGFSAVPVGSNGGTCAISGGGDSVNIASSTGALVGSGPTTFCSISYSVLPGTPLGGYDILVSNSNPTACFDSLGFDIQPCTPISNGAGQLIVANLLQPVLSSFPVPASTIAINASIGGGGATAPLTVSNSGLVGSILSVGAPTGLSGVLSISPNDPQNIVQGGGVVTYMISCDPVVVGTTSQVLTLSHNGISPGSPVEYTIECVGSAGAVAPTASLGAVALPGQGPIFQTALGSVPINVDSAGQSMGQLDLSCTIPSTGAANFIVVSGATRTINAPAAIGANAPDISISCVRQATAVAATLTCTQNATPDPDPAPLTTTIICPSGFGGSNFASVPSPGGTIALAGPTGSTVAGSLEVNNGLGSFPLNISNCAASPGFSIEGATAFVVPPSGNGSVLISCVAPAAGQTFTGSLACDHDATNVGSPVIYLLTCNGMPGAIPTTGNAGRILLVCMMIGLGLLGMGPRRQA